MVKRIKYPSVGGFNAKKGSIQSVRPSARRKQDSYIEYTKLTEWESINNLSRSQSTRAIAQKKLLAVKHKGIWWVAINPDCEEKSSDF